MSLMKKLILFLILLILLSSCSSLKQTEEPPYNHAGGTEEERVQFMTGKGYNVLESNGIAISYVLEREMLKDMHYGIQWGLQNVEMDQYIGKEIIVYSYIIKNHPADEMSDKRQTKLWLITCDNIIIGGYSIPNCTAEVMGSGYSLEGHCLEEITGLSYQEWHKMWIRKYK